MIPQLGNVTEVTKFHVEEQGSIKENRASHFGTELPGLKDSQATVISFEDSVLAQSFLNSSSVSCYRAEPGTKVLF